MPYRQTIEHCLEDAIGPTGIDRSTLDATITDTAAAIGRLRRDDRNLPLLMLPGESADMPDLAALATRYRDQFDDVVILGTGGSSLGGRCLCALSDTDSPRLHFMDNVDPHSFHVLFRRIDPLRTGILSISKSGGTAETIAQTLLCLTWLNDAGAALSDHAMVITELSDNPLRRLAQRNNLQTRDHDPELGGRYSVLSSVGMLPALIAGLDAQAVRNGAAAVLDAALSADDPENCVPAVGAAISVALMRTHGIMGTVLMPYIDRLAPFNLWFRQLWAESLGKGGNGTTPINAVGTVDQHSQLQLYLDGPNDKMFTIIAGSGSGGDLDKPFVDADTDLAYLSGRRLGDLLSASQRGTVDALAAAGRPVRVISMDSVDEFALGGLMMHFMLETVVAAHLLGVNPFDQPAVEDGKRRTRHYLDAMGDA